MNKMTLADTLATTLNELGVSHVFGVSGANIELFHDALIRQGDGETQGKIKSILCKSEFGAAFMADGYSRQSQKLGVCCATSGGGMMNLAVGIAEARASGIPMLAIVGCPPSQLHGHGAFQDASGGPNQVDAKALWAAISKFSVTLEPTLFWQQLKQAISLAVSGNPGPCSLLIPRDHMAAEVAAKPADWPVSLANFVVESTIDEVSLFALQRDIAASQRPMIIAGPTMMNDDTLETYSSLTGIPVATTLESVSAFSQHHVRYIGVVGVAGHQSAHTYLENADLIIALGSQLDIMTRAPINGALKNKRLWIIHTDTSSAPPCQNLFKLTTSANKVIQVLCHQGQTQLLNFHSIDVPALAYYKPRPIQISDSAAQCMSTHGALSSLQAYLSKIDTLFLDAGNCAASAAHYLKLSSHCRSTIALGMGGMGYAVCAAMGAQFSQPNNRTMVICGDGAFLVTGMEIHTAIQYQLPILWVIFNDAQHGMCTSRQRHFFNSRLTTAQYSRPDFSRVVEGLAGEHRLWHGQAKQAGEIAGCLEEYFSLSNAIPGVLDLVISQEEIPPFFPLAETPINVEHRNMEDTATIYALK